MVRTSLSAPLPAGPANSNEFSCGTVTVRSPALDPPLSPFSLEAASALAEFYSFLLSHIAN